MITVKIIGLKKIEKKLKKLDPNKAKGLLRASLRAGGRVVVKAAKARLGSNYKTLRKSLTVRVKRQRSARFMDAEVGPTVGRDAKYNGWYAHIVEGGADPHTIPKSNKRGDRNAKTLQLDEKTFRSVVQHPGIAARPFMRPAYDNNVKAIEKAFAKKMWEGINKLL